jgi:phage terminase large subunit-like protein
VTTRRERIVFVQALVEGCITILHEICDVTLYTYQLEMADRIFFSLLIEDAEEVTIEAARQSGKSETLASVSATAMVIFPKLAALYPDDPVISKFKNGILIGCFAPVDDQADTIFSRITERLTSEKATAFLSDREINDEVRTKGNELITKSGSLCRRQTAHAKAKIESKTYHLVIIDEAQEADATKVRRSIHPMTVATAGTIIKVGTPAAYKSDYYEAIQRNGIRGPTNGKKNHFSFDWKRAAKENPRYAASIAREKDRLGEDSDEFKMSYALVWLLERGMFITNELVDELGDRTMNLILDYHESPVVIGIDVARTFDSTLITVVWVDWANPDEFGLYDHRILNWLEIHGEDWESQYAQIVEFCSHYRVMLIGVDAQGMGNPVHERLQ